MDKRDKPAIGEKAGSRNESGIPFGSNHVRLSGREWLVVGVVFSALLFLGPRFWERLEKFEPGSDYRVPYKLGSDYWLYDRYCRWAAARYETLVIGDSVIWGHYVSRRDTLSHYLNETAGRPEFANLAVDGIHPAALMGLLKYYGRDITGKRVILHLNPLWMSSRKHDLQVKKEFHFNHPRLVPQFIPKIPCYKESYSGRLSVVIERNVPFLSWASHLRKTYFNSMPLPTWTMEHPYENPLRSISLELPAPETDGQGEAISWGEKGTAQADFEWVELGTSLQWKFFQNSVEMLRARGNRVFVVVGPFNEHMLKDKSIETYRRMTGEIGAWLQQKDIAYYVPPVLPSELYCDASHPLAEGYSMLAKQLFEDDSFRSYILQMPP